MTRAEAIERDFVAWRRPENQIEDAFMVAYDAALIAGLERALRVIGAKGTVEEAEYGLMIAKSLIRAEIALRKGAKRK